MKFHHYVAVFTADGIKYVTSVDNTMRNARWDDFQEAKKFPKSVADEICFGLNMNRHSSVVIRALSNMHFFNGKCIL